MGISREELSYAAGIFEGEGCIIGDRNSRDPYRRIRASVANTDLEVLNRVQNALGGRINNSSAGTNKRCYALVWNGVENVQAVIVAMWPWLSRRRKDKYKECLAYVLDSKVVIRPRRRPASARVNLGQEN